VFNKTQQQFQKILKNRMFENKQTTTNNISTWLLFLYRSVYQNIPGGKKNKKKKG